MQPVCYLNDGFVELDKAGFPVGDLGVQRAYGIFDFIRVTGNLPVYINDHLERLYRSAKEMRLDIGKSAGELRTIISELLARNGLSDSGLRILLTGGISADGYEITRPNLAVIQLPLTPPPAELPASFKLVTYHYMRELPHIKTTNYQMAIWLNPWVKENGADDVLYYKDGLLCECPRSNFFLVLKDDTVVTPSRNVLPGITRKYVLKLAAEHGISIEERDITIDEIRTAKSAFISSSTKRIIPVRQVDDHVFEKGGHAIAEKLFSLLLQQEKTMIAATV